MDPSALPPDQNRGPEVLAVLWTFGAVALIVVGLKIYTRLQVLKETGIDDVLIVVSAVGFKRSQSANVIPFVLTGRYCADIPAYIEHLDKCYGSLWFRPPRCILECQTRTDGGENKSHR